MKCIKIFLTALTITIFSSCYKSKLNQPVPGLLSAQQVANKTGVEGLLIGAYSVLDGFAVPPGNTAGPWGTAASNWIYGSICGSEAYKGGPDQPEIGYIETFIATASNDYFNDKWAAVYEGVQRADAVLRVMRQAKDMTTADTIEVKAEALFLRAHYHFEAKKMWNKIPFVDESVTYDSGNYHIPNDTTWSHIEKDLIYAVNNLPATQAAVGRANKYAAEALLAKAYMFEHKYVQAKPLLADLITNGMTSNGLKYALNSLYSDNFNIATKNSAESVFACQSSVNDNAGGTNGDNGDLLNYPNGGEAGCCGFFQPSQYLVNHFKTDPVTGLPDLITFNNIDVKNDEGIQSSDPFTPYGGTLDPRLDWTVGRRGIPYLDWQIHPGFDWIRGNQYYGPYSPKKDVYYKTQEAAYVQNNFSLVSAMNINFIRFADVLLWAAETEVEIGSLDKAEAYVNLIRARAGNRAGFVHTYIDDAHPEKGFTNNPAANYLIKVYPPGYFAAQGQAFARKAVRYERMLELGMEGHRFFDLVRWGIANTEINAYLLNEQILRDHLKGAVFTPNKNEYFPIPQTQIDLSAGANGVREMTQNPGY